MALHGITVCLDAVAKRLGRSDAAARERNQHRITLALEKLHQALGGQLRRLAPTLRSVGVEVWFSRGGGHRTITLQRIKLGVAAPSASRAASSAGGGRTT